LNRRIENVFIPRFFCQIWLKSRTFFQLAFNIFKNSVESRFSFWELAFLNPVKLFSSDFNIAFFTIQPHCVENSLAYFTKKFFYSKKVQFDVFLWR